MHPGMPSQPGRGRQGRSKCPMTLDYRGGQAAESSSSGRLYVLGSLKSIPLWGQEKYFTRSLKRLRVGD